MSLGLHLSKLRSELFQFPPRNNPDTLPPPPPTSKAGSRIFSISENVFHKALDPRLPLTFATIYIFSIFLLNSYNRRRGNKPWNISKTRLFACFVIMHNIFLAVYSGWTFLGMWTALQKSIPFPSSYDLMVEMVDSLCKIHGPRGIGESVVYNTSTSQWAHQSTITMREAEIVELQSTGRLWNEGLAFYGWIFYLSKLYEIIDTFILVVKGKRSSTLQTYHHAGAMICMWSGIRYMSPPIWMFVFVNSAIHSCMYTYYTFTALKIPVPRFLKKSLTTLQILQFIVGACFAAAHSFISYSYFVERPPSQSISEDTATTTTSSVIGTASTNLFSRTVKMLLTSLGRSDIAPPAGLESRQYVPLRAQKITISCLDTTGQNFAIWFNVIYLMPLIFLFVRFFTKSYLKSINSYGKTEFKTNNAKLSIEKEVTNEEKVK